jgi:diguanylate cyclase (GGDEF)-like protein
VSALSLHGFLLANREEILERSRTKLGGREAPTPTEAELTEGLPRFLDQLIGVLDAKNDDPTTVPGNVASSASLHGRELLRRGLTVGQVVQDYGSICQSVTEVAAERHTAITAEEFQTFNQCLDEAIAGAVTEYEHERDRSLGDSGVEQLGFLAHEMRNLLSTSILTFEVLTRGSVGVNSNTGALLGRSLRRMRVLVDRTLAQVRLEADVQTPERVVVAALIEEIEIVATIEAKSYDVHLSIETCAHDIAVVVDHQILASVVANLVQNAFKFTRRRGHVAIRAFAKDERVFIEVHDECGGLPPDKAAELFRPFGKRGVNQTGLGLGLSISLKGVQAIGGQLTVRDLPGQGCVFTVELPQAPRGPTDEDDLGPAPARLSARSLNAPSDGPSDGPSGALSGASSLPSLVLSEEEENVARILATVTREASLLADAMTDSLTGLANHRRFAQHLDHELERSRRYELPLSLITLGLDHLKAINDEHGQGAGDDAIRLVSRVLTGAVRRFELVARRGGNEFAVILPNTGAADARQLADRLLDAVGAQDILGRKLSASIGLASWENRNGRNEKHVEVEAFLKAGDDALSRAKRAGRDRIEAHEM